MCVCDQAVNQGKNHHYHDIRHNPTEKAFYSFFRADFRTKLMLSQKCSGKIGTSIGNPCRRQCQNNACQTKLADMQQSVQHAQRMGNQKCNCGNKQGILICDMLMQQNHFCKHRNDTKECQCDCRRSVSVIL